MEVAAKLSMNFDRCKFKMLRKTVTNIGIDIVWHWCRFWIALNELRLIQFFFMSCTFIIYQA